MYDDIYAAMPRAGGPYVSIKIGQHCFRKSTKRYGHSIKHELTHPEHVLFVNEIGDNTSQKQDGLILGRRFQERNSYND
jgi:hypothetical protein